MFEYSCGVLNLVRRLNRPTICRPPPGPASVHPPPRGDLSETKLTFKLNLLSAPLKGAFMALICSTALSLMLSCDYTPLASSTRSAASWRSAPHDNAEGSTYRGVSWRMNRCKVWIWRSNEKKSNHSTLPTVWCTDLSRWRYYSLVTHCCLASDDG